MRGSQSDLAAFFLLQKPSRARSEVLRVRIGNDCFPSSTRKPFETSISTVTPPWLDFLGHWDIGVATPSINSDVEIVGFVILTPTTSPCVETQRFACGIFHRYPHFKRRSIQYFVTARDGCCDHKRGRLVCTGSRTACAAGHPHHTQHQCQRPSDRGETTSAVVSGKENFDRL